jgi:predicted DsbA family dithiol-disulfide isomerase
VTHATVIRIEVWFDLVCPWCLIGKRHLDSALRIFRRAHPDVAVDVAWHSHPLMPGIPTDGFPFADFYLKRLGSAGAVARRRAQVSEAALSAGETIAFDRIARFPNTLAAHRLVARAQGDGGSAKAQELIEALFDAYFVRGQDIGAPSVLAAIAARHGIEMDGPALPSSPSPLAGRGVPLFRFNSTLTVEGAQAPRALLDALERTLASVDADRFAETEN